MKIVLVAGGKVDESMLAFLDQWRYDKIIGVDKGVEFLYRHHITPDYIVGDFDSLDKEILVHYEKNTPIKRLIPEKDATDTQTALELAMEMGATDIAILGGTGSRLDHVLGNIQVLSIPLKKGIKAFIQDANNRIELIDKEKYIKKEQVFGKYISFLPLTSCVTGVILEGFKYPLKDYTLTGDNSLGVSNEVVENEAHVDLDEGILIMIQSKD